MPRRNPHRHCARIFAGLSSAYEHRLFTISTSSPWALGVIFLLDDFIYYWFHRISECRFWWAAHVNHHSSQEYNFSTAVRQSWSSVIVGTWTPWIGFESVLNTPSNHRVHHASNPRYLDRNYAGVLMVWDRLFGARSAREAAGVVFGPPGWRADGQRLTSKNIRSDIEVRHGG